MGGKQQQQKFNKSQAAPKEFHINIIGQG